ncbi:MAG TPA: methyltransferase [Micromonosporaceae bacterium]|nr:methyltransferase [Micromonosporaceae bacterium]
MTYPALLSPDGIDRLRDALAAAAYTSDGIAAHIGPEATAAARRNHFRPALAATGASAPLDTLIRLYVCGQAEPDGAVEAAFAPLPLADVVTAGLVERTPDGLRAGLDLEPYGNAWWVVSDLPSGSRPGPLRSDHVLGVGNASTTLADSVIRRPVASALDIGTGCGVQALHLSAHATRVVATDVSERALRFAATTAALAGLEWDLRRGDLVEPVRDDRFDVVVSNPPFVVGPGAATHTYRDSGRAGDAVGAELAAAAKDLLNPDGTMQFLANWLHVAGEDWAERVTGWFAGSGLDVWVIERELADPVAYVDLWLADAAEEDDGHRSAVWLDWFDAQKVEGVGFGLITARRAGHDDPVVRVETVRQQLARPFGDEIGRWFERQDWLRLRPGPESLLAERYFATPGLTLHQEAEIGIAGWDVTRQVLVQTAGLRWSEEIDPVLLALIAGCDGSVPLREQVAVLAAAYGAPVEPMAAMAAVLVPHLIERGFIEPAGAPGPDRTNASRTDDQA